MTAVPRIDLELGPKVGSGAQGSLFRVTSVRSAEAAALPSPLIYKEFLASTPVSGAGLAALARFRDAADAHDREVIDAMTVWPVAVVEDGSDRASGYLMRSIPDGFFQPIETTAGSERIPREIQELFVAENLARKNFGETAKGIERMALCREMAFVLGFLHKRDFVYGDLSYKNAVFCLRPRPSVILLDCDAIRHIGETSGVPQLHSPGWKPPEGGPQTKATDRYKLGLFVLRTSTLGVNAQNRDPDKAVGHLDAAGLSLLRRALDDQPERRTTGKEWVAYFNARIAAAGGVHRRSGTAPRPSRPTTRRSTTPSWEHARGQASPRQAYVLTPGGVRQTSATVAPVGMSTGWVRRPVGITSNPVWASTRRAKVPSVFTLGARSHTLANPPIVTQTSAYVVGFFTLLAVLAGILLFGLTASSGSRGGSATATTARGASASTTSGVADAGSSDAGQATTQLARSAESAVVDAKKFVNAIDQRVVGLYLPDDGTAYRAGDTSPPWVVQFSTADPDRSSGQPVWAIRNVQQGADGSFHELPPTTKDGDRLAGPTGLWGTGLDNAIGFLPSLSFAGVELQCNPSGPECIWRFATSPAPAYFTTGGIGLPTPPTWAG